MKARFVPRAQRDVEEIYARNVENSPQRAARVEAAMRGDVELMELNPEIGHAAGHRQARRWAMPEYDYTIFYRIDWEQERIDILRVVDSRRVRNLNRVPR